MRIVNRLHKRGSNMNSSYRIAFPIRRSLRGSDATEEGARMILRNPNSCRYPDLLTPFRLSARSIKYDNLYCELRIGSFGGLPSRGEDTNVACGRLTLQSSHGTALSA